VVKSYTVVLAWDEEVGGYNVTVPALPGCYTQGDSIEEALANAREAIEGFIETLRQVGEAVPEESREPHVERVAVSVS
jgi:predicted RNase H-like HicB family nuclease